MINFDDVERENINEHNLNLPQTPDHVFRILITGGTGSGKTNALLTVYTNKTMKDPKVLIECSNKMQDVYKNIEEYNPTRKCNVLTIFNDTIADMISNLKLSPIVTELFITEK